MLFTLFKNKRRNKGFTLVEVLVVVLIIGVLSAVALPTYRRAVEKTRAVQGITTLEHIAKAQVAYNAKRGEYASTVFSLPINLEDNNGSEVSGSQFNDRFFTYHIFGNQNASATAARSTGEYTLLIDYASGEVTCQAVEGSTICERLGLGEDNWEFPTSEDPGSVQESQSNTESDSGSGQNTGNGPGDEGNTNNNPGDGQNTGNGPGDEGNTNNESGDGGNSGSGPGDEGNTNNESGDGGNTNNNPGDEGNTNNEPGDEGNTNNNPGDEGNTNNDPEDEGNSDPGFNLEPLNPGIVIVNPEYPDTNEYTDSNYRLTCLDDRCSVYQNGKRITYDGDDFNVLVSCQDHDSCTIKHTSNSDNDSEWKCEGVNCICQNCFERELKCTLNSTRTGCVDGEEVRWFDAIYKKYNDAANYAIVDITGGELAGSIVSNEGYRNQYDDIIKDAIRNGISIEDTTDKLFDLYKEYLEQSS